MAAPFAGTLALRKRLAPVQQTAGFIPCLAFRKLSQVQNGALKTGMGIISRRTREPREKFGHSLTCKVGLNPCHFKAGAGGREV